jgi:hypothetical protein
MGVSMRVFTLLMFAVDFWWQVVQSYPVPHVPYLPVAVFTLLCSIGLFADALRGAPPSMAKTTIRTVAAEAATA